MLTAPQSPLVTDAQWREAAARATGLVGTPCYIFVLDAVKSALAELSTSSGLRRRHWLSLKTQPIRPLLLAWYDWGLGVEVVSEYELAAVISEGVSSQRILVNGVAKHTWLPQFSVQHLNVHLESISEVIHLRDIARRRHWRVGLRCHVPNERDPEEPAFPDQFGLTVDEVQTAVHYLRAGGVEPAGLHFHIGGHVPSVREYEIGIRHLAFICELTGLRPDYVDVGGGLPVNGERLLHPTRTTPDLTLEDLDGCLAALPRLFPSLEEVWLENGRRIAARAGALVTRVLDRKERPECVFLICDGGRINHARMAGLEQHEIVTTPDRGGGRRLTTVCGPTSTGADKLTRCMLPETISTGDLILWLNGGAYHIPLETRFSVGLAPVVLLANGEAPRVARRRETAEEWWSQWL